MDYEYEAWMRCPFCEIQYMGVIESLGTLKRGDRVLDQCPHCQTVGNMIFLRELSDIDRGLLNG